MSFRNILVSSCWLLVGFGVALNYSITVSRPLVNRPEYQHYLRTGLIPFSGLYSQQALDQMLAERDGSSDQLEAAMECKIVKIFGKSISNDCSGSGVVLFTNNLLFKSNILF